MTTRKFARQVGRDRSLIWRLCLQYPELARRVPDPTRSCGWRFEVHVEPMLLALAEHPPQKNPHRRPRPSEPRITREPVVGHAPG